MLLTPHQSTEDLIVQSLSSEKKDVKEIHTSLKYKSKTITIQALYRALKVLVQDGVLVKTGTFFTVNKEWSQSIVEYFGNDEFPTLSNGEELSYSFKSLSTLDAYWKHTIVQLNKTLGEYPIFFYNSHVV